MTYTHGHAPSVLRAHGTRTVADSAAYLLPHLVPGMTVLDVGCGPGSITVDLARVVSPGKVVGVDPATAALTAAQEHLTDVVQTGELSDEAVCWAAADVMSLPFATNAFDVTHAHQVLQHLPDPVGAIREMVRVTRPGGLIAIRDVDYATVAWNPPSQALTDWLDLYHQVARVSGGEPDAGRHLVEWALAAGLTHAQLQATASGWAYTDHKVRRWAQIWAQRILQSQFTHTALDEQLADQTTLNQLAAGWVSWADQPAAWFAMLHSDLLIRLPDDDV